MDVWLVLIGPDVGVRGEEVREGSWDEGNGWDVEHRVGGGHLLRGAVYSRCLLLTIGDLEMSSLI